MKTTWLVISLGFLVAAGALIAFVLMSSNLFAPHPIAILPAQELPQPDTANAPQYAPSVQKQTASGGNKCSATYGNPPPPSLWRIATSTGVEVYLQDNNVYVNGVLVVANIPQQFRLSPADGVGLQNFYENFAVGPFCDYYSPIVISPDGTSFAFLYSRSEIAEDPVTGIGNRLQTSLLLVYDRSGKQLLKEDLMTTDYEGKSSLEYASHGLIERFGPKAIFVVFSNGKEGASGQPVAYFLDGGILELPDGSWNSSALSPDDGVLLYNEQQKYGAETCPGVSVYGMDSRDYSELRLFDILSGTSTLVICDPANGFSPVGWTKDGGTALVLIVKNDPNNPNSAVYTSNFLLYDRATKKVSVNSAPDARAAYDAVCKNGYDCSDSSIPWR